jgi:hypothetical protein
MDFDFTAQDPALTRRPRGPIAVWLLAAFIGAVLGVATVAANLTTDTRDFVARHATVLKSQAL